MYSVTRAQGPVTRDQGPVTSEDITAKTIFSA